MSDEWNEDEDERDDMVSAELDMALQGLPPRIALAYAVVRDPSTTRTLKSNAQTVLVQYLNRETDK
jgi:hypothetical protein